MIAATALASVQAIGDIFPYADTNSATYLDQVAAPWAAGCATLTKQSPIDLKSASATAPTVDPGHLSINGFDQTHVYGMDSDGLSVYLSHIKPPAFADNRFHTVPSVTGGPLGKKTYVFNHVEFKYASEGTTHGSEHSMDGKFDPFEMQMVFYDVSASATKTYAAAVDTGKADAVAILSFPFEISTTDNADIAEIIAVAEVPLVKGTKADTATFIFSKIINPTTPADVLEDFYYYDGSLTQPGDTAANDCREVAKWIIFSTKLQISAAQLTSFRKVAGLSVNANKANVRNIKTNSNTVYHRKKPDPTKEPNNAALVAAASILGLGTFGAVFSLLSQPDTSKALRENPITDILATAQQQLFGPDLDERNSFNYVQHEPNHHHHPQQLNF